MRILTRYILREVASHAAIGVAVFTFVIFMRDLGKIMELVVRNSAPLPSVAEIFAYTLPTALTLTIPMGVLVGILIALSRLSADSEVTAMRSAGLGAWTLVRMIAVFFIGAWLLAMFNNLYLAPRSAAALSRLQDRLRSSQASFEIQPRVFYEDLPNYVLYVQDASSAQGKAVWRGIFLGDVSTPGAPKVTLARSGIVVAEAQDRLRLHLLSGSQHETVPRQSEQYSISTFAETDIPVQMAASAQRARETAPATEASTGELIARASQQKDPAEARSFRIEFHRRLALPTSCIVLALVGIPLGLSAKKGGRSTGFVLTILLVFIYYAVSLSGISLSRQGKMPPWAGLWLANAVFFVGGLVLLYRVDQMPIHIPSWRVLWTRLRHWIREPRTFDGAAQQVPQWRLRSQGVRDAFKRASHLPPLKHGRFPMILDDLIVRNFFFHLAMILSTFLMLLLVFTFFELLRDIIRNRIVLALVGKYLISLIPYLFYNLLPMSVLLAVLVTFGLMQKANEITAIKATGISIYRAIAPVLVLAGILAAGMFLFDQFYLPQANKRQDALRNQIKGKAAQTYLRPERKWIFGTHSNIYYY
jgi:LPS export ABC transporter permease LptF